MDKLCCGIDINNIELTRLLQVESDLMVKCCQDLPTNQQEIVRLTYQKIIEIENCCKVSLCQLENY